MRRRNALHGMHVASDTVSDNILLMPLERRMLPRIQVREYGIVDWRIEPPKERAIITLDERGLERMIVDVLGLEAMGFSPQERYALWVQIPVGIDGGLPDVHAFYLDTLYGYQAERQYTP